MNAETLNQVTLKKPQKPTNLFFARTILALLPPAHDDSGTRVGPQLEVAVEEELPALAGEYSHFGAVLLLLRRLGYEGHVADAFRLRGSFAFSERVAAVVVEEERAGNQELLGTW